MRAQRRLSQKKFAEKLGVSLRAYQNYERGEREVPAALIRALFEAFQIDPVWLLTGIAPNEGAGAGQIKAGLRAKIERPLFIEIFSEFARTAPVWMLNTLYQTLAMYADEITAAGQAVKMGTSPEEAATKFVEQFSRHVIERWAEREIFVAALCCTIYDEVVDIRDRVARSKVIREEVKAFLRLDSAARGTSE